MKFAETADMHKLVKTKWTPRLMTDALKLHDIPINMMWAHKDKLEEMCYTYAVQQGWDPETTFVWWSYPPDPEPDPDAEIDDALVSNELGGEVFESLSKLNSTQCACLLFRNMTPEKFAGLIDQVVNMKAFL